MRSVASMLTCDGQEHTVACKVDAVLAACWGVAVRMLPQTARPRLEVEEEEGDAGRQRLHLRRLRRREPEDAAIQALRLCVARAPAL